MLVTALPELPNKKKNRKSDPKSLMITRIAQHWISCGSAASRRLGRRLFETHLALCWNRALPPPPPPLLLALHNTPLWNMHAPDINACPWHRRAFARSNSGNGLVWVSLLPKSLPFHRSHHAQILFPRFPLVAEPLTYPSLLIPALYSRVLRTIFGRPHHKNSKWEGKIHWAHVQA